MKVTHGRWYIYTLSDPRTGDCRYVGKTVDPKRRHYRHCIESPTYDTYLGRWLRGLVSSGLKPTFSIIDSGFGNGYVAAERAWYRELLREGCRLTNTAEPGMGGSGPCSEAARRKISQKKMGVKRPDGFSEKMRAIALARPPISDATRQKMSESRKGKPLGSAGAHKAWATRRARGNDKMSDEQKDKLRQANLGKKASVETRRKMSKSHTKKRSH